jgi:hypothetical protein
LKAIARRAQYDGYFGIGGKSQRDGQSEIGSS